MSQLFSLTDFKAPSSRFKPSLSPLYNYNLSYSHITYLLYIIINYTCMFFNFSISQFYTSFSVISLSSMSTLTSLNKSPSHQHHFFSVLLSLWQSLKDASHFAFSKLFHTMSLNYQLSPPFDCFTLSGQYKLRIFKILWYCKHFCTSLLSQIRII